MLSKLSLILISTLLWAGFAHAENSIKIKSSQNYIADASRGNIFGSSAALADAKSAAAGKALKSCQKDGAECAAATFLDSNCTGSYSLFGSDCLVRAMVVGTKSISLDELSAASKKVLFCSEDSQRLSRYYQDLMATEKDAQDQAKEQIDSIVRHLEQACPDDYAPIPANPNRAVFVDYTSEVRN